MTSSGVIEVWVTLDGEPLAAALAALSADPRVTVEQRPWPETETQAGPDVLVVPTETPESVATVRARLGGPRELPAIVVISTDASIDAARRSVVAGANGVLLAEEVRTSLPAAVHATCAGLLVLSPSLSHAIARPSLTTREKQILAMVVMGMSNQEIATRLFVAESTVKSHLFSAYRRLGVRTRREAVAVITDPDRGLGSGILGLTGP